MIMKCMFLVFMFLINSGHRQLKKKGMVRTGYEFCEISDLKTPDWSVELCGISVTNIEPFDVYVCYRTPGLTLKQDQWDLIFLTLKVVTRDNGIFSSVTSTRTKGSGTAIRTI